jgi:hypothetical protein
MGRERRIIKQQRVIKSIRTLEKYYSTHIMQRLKLRSNVKW